LKKSKKIHHTCSYIVKNQMSGHSYTVPALCELLTKKYDINLLISSPSNLNFKPSFEIFSFIPNFFEKPVLGSRNFFKKLDHLTDAGDIIHNHGIWRMHNIYSYRIKKNKDVKVIISPRGSLSKEALKISSFKKNIFNFIFGHKKVIENCDAFHATSEKEKIEIRKLGFKQPIAVIPNGINMPVERKNKFRVKNSRNFLYLGRIHPIKGLETLIHSWVKMEKNSNCKLEICGYYNDKKYFDKLKKIVKENGLKNVTFSKPVSGKEKIDKFLSSDIFILPSKTENFGIVIAEAMSLGLPVITTNNTPWECIREKNLGWYSDLNEEKIYQSMIQASQTSQNDLIVMSKKSRNYVKNEFDWESLLSKYDQFYKWILNKDEKPSFVTIFSS